MTATTAPDVEAVAWAALKDLGGITVFQVDGGSEWPGRIELCQLQVDVRASSKKRARDRAYAARDRLLAWEAASWVGQPLAVQAVSVVQGPAWLPEPDGAPRYVFRVDVRCHPQP